MRKSGLSWLLVLAGVVVAGGSAAEAATCTPTGFYRDGLNMTAALFNPTAAVTGNVDATGCNIGVYYSAGAGGRIAGADIHGANYFGVVVNGDAGDVTVDILNSQIHDIGDSPFTGAQHGVAIYYRAFFLGGGTTGRIAGNTISRYQKGGIVTNGVGTHVTISDNAVLGEGPVSYIAQNGIQVGYGATASVMRNTVSGHSYTGTSTVSGGIIVVGGPGYGICPDGGDCPYSVNARIMNNTVINNDVGIFLTNLAADFSAPLSATNIKAVNNTISNSALTNLYAGVGYQAGISDVGNNDKMITNTISGAGYSPSPLCMPSCPIDADVSFTNRPKVHANK